MQRRKGREIHASKFRNYDFYGSELIIVAVFTAAVGLASRSLMGAAFGLAAGSVVALKTDISGGEYAKSPTARKLSKAGLAFAVLILICNSAILRAKNHPAEPARNGMKMAAQAGVSTPR